ncbi:hypothetical protein ON058_07470 [Demequina sp. B12]|uniref:hypothetical protein n=1 Tax=Demequina sp. B12 TaxID=2992757 RepID=UPI00237A29B1|nr:hypothetical protein [Demequina sp. B12]MDE0573250.1 hypothetical protein [Demequina sp. B12]
MSEFPEQREPLGEVSYPSEVREALRAVTELPSDLGEQADFFDKIQSSLSNRLREEQ